MTGRAARTLGAGMVLTLVSALVIALDGVGFTLSDFALAVAVAVFALGAGLIIVGVGEATR